MDGAGGIIAEGGTATKSQTVGVRLVRVRTPPELAFPPLNMIVPRFKRWLASDGNEIVCAARSTATEFATDKAVLKLAFPAWLAVTLHEPAPVAVSVAPAIAQGPDVTL